MNASGKKIDLTRIELCFYIRLFLEECPIYNALGVGEFDGDTLACNFLRKHIIAPAIEQGEEFVAECKKKRLPESDQHFFYARRVLRLFKQLEHSVVQVNAGDAMVHLRMMIYTPAYRGVPETGEQLERYVQQFILRVMQGVTDNLAEENRVPAFREVYRTFGDQLEGIIKGSDGFVHMQLTNELR